MPQNNKNDAFYTKAALKIKSIPGDIKNKFHNFSEKSPKEKRSAISDFILNNAMYIIIITAIVIIAVMEPRFISSASIVNIISLTAARLPIALGIGGAIVLSGTDISAGRAVGLTACIAASLLQS